MHERTIAIGAARRSIFLCFSIRNIARAKSAAKSTTHSVKYKTVYIPEFNKPVKPAKLK